VSPSINPEFTTVFLNVPPLNVNAPTVADGKNPVCAFRVTLTLSPAEKNMFDSPTYKVFAPGTKTPYPLPIVE